MGGIVRQLADGIRAGDWTASPLLAPSYLLPSQQPGRHHYDLQPERRLIVAVLEDALDTLRRTARGGVLSALAKRRREDEVRWFLSDETFPYTFRWVCYHLGFDVSAVRAALDRCQWNPRPVQGSLRSGNGHHAITSGFTFDRGKHKRVDVHPRSVRYIGLTKRTDLVS